LTLGRQHHALRSWQLFAVSVLIWGTTWHAIVHQLQQATPELGVAVRFTVAGLLVLAWAVWRGERLRFSPEQHALLALQGVFMYSVSYICVYHAEKHIPSGLVAVGYSAQPLLLGVATRLLWGTPLTGRFVVGGLMGVAGVAMIFGPEFAQMSADARSAWGAAFTVAAVGLSSVGNLVAARNGENGLPFVPVLGYGMLYGSVVSWGFVWAGGQPLAWPTGWLWWSTLLYLAAFGSVVAFGCYLVLQQRIGVGPASTVGVATTVIALLVSVLLEGYRPGLLALTGVVLAITGNALALGWKPGRPGR
jgi:drug/metabolite transporter (DMT)-like permease